MKFLRLIFVALLSSALMVGWAISPFTHLLVLLLLLLWLFDVALAFVLDRPARTFDFVDVIYLAFLPLAIGVVVCKSIWNEGTPNEAKDAV